MKNGNLAYHPYRSHSYFIPFVVGISIFAFVVIGCLWEDIHLSAFIFYALAILCGFFIKFLFDTSKVKIFFEDDGFRLIDDKHKKDCYVLWKDLPYAYYSRSYKGHLFVVLSPEVLSLKQVKQFVNLSANSSKISIDKVFVIYIDFLQDISRIYELLDKKALYIDAE